jgi:hypothetical protein
MNEIEWLKSNAPRFDELTADEVAAILHFTLLWSLFEAKVLSNNASSNRVLALVHDWEARHILDASKFHQPIEYFKSRYFNNGDFTYYFDGLRLRPNDTPELVKNVLRGANSDPADSVAALLIIVYRLRNNLFHGEKWSYELRDQFENFTNANQALMAAIETHACP